VTFLQTQKGYQVWDKTDHFCSFFNAVGFVWYPHVKKANSNHKKKDGKESGSSDEEDAKPGAK